MARAAAAGAVGGGGGGTSPEERPSGPAELSLEEVLKAYEQPVNEEQAWAVCFQCCRGLLLLAPAEAVEGPPRWGPAGRIRDPADIRLHKDGAVSACGEYGVAGEWRGAAAAAAQPSPARLRRVGEGAGPSPAASLAARARSLASALGGRRRLRAPFALGGGGLRCGRPSGLSALTPTEPRGGGGLRDSSREGQQKPRSLTFR